MTSSQETIETNRLVLRRWQDGDADSLYEYARDPAVGPIAGWPSHQSVEESREIIGTVFAAPETYAVCLKDDGRAIGAIALKFGDDADLADADDEAELGYWLGRPFWGQGIMSEASEAILRHAFEDLDLARVWSGYYEGNKRSWRVQEKCGFRYQRTCEGVDVPLMGERRTEHVSCITRKEWEQLSS